VNDKTRIAVLQRVGAVIGSDRPIPQTWAEFTVTEQLAIANADPEIAAVLQGQGYMSADLEQQVLSGKLAAAYEGQTLEQQQAAERQAAIAAVEQSMAADIEQLHQRNAAMAQLREHARQESLIAGQAMQVAAARASFGMGA
jgi:3-hydroxyacyl-CoA dehydrogenase